MERRWNIEIINDQKISALQEELKISPVLCAILIKRGIDTFQKAKDYFRPNITHLHNPFEITM